MLIKCKLSRLFGLIFPSSYLHADLYLNFTTSKREREREPVRERERETERERERERERDLKGVLRSKPLFSKIKENTFHTQCNFLEVTTV